MIFVICVGLWLLQVYKVMVTSDNHSWFVFRRYNEFYKLYEMLKKQVNIMCLMNTDSIVILLVVLYKTVTLSKEHASVWEWSVAGPLKISSHMYV